MSRLEAKPEIGRIHPEDRSLRELVIPSGASGYVALYRFEAAEDLVAVLAFRHQREAGW